MNHFSKNLRFLLEKFSVKQSQLATFIGKSQNSISNWIHEISAPDIRDLVGISTFFGISMDDLALRDLERSKTISSLQLSRFQKRMQVQPGGNRVSRLYSGKPEEEAMTFQEPQPGYGKAIVNQVKEIQVKLDELRKTAEKLLKEKRK